MTQTSASDRGQLKRAKLNENLDEKQLLEDFRVVLDLPAGRRIFWWILGIGHMFKTTFTGNSQGMFLEGMRNLSLQIYDKILDADQEKIFVMMRESQSREEAQNG